MNRQQIFNTVSKHLLTQKSRAMSQDGQSCRYRAPNGRKCAIGVLIPDENYISNLEGRSVTAQEVLDALELTDLKLYDIEFLEQLQFIHDCSKPDEWAKKLKTFAQTYNLTFSGEP